MRNVISLVTILAACGGGKDGNKDPGGSAAVAVKPIAIAYGDCAGASVSFVSGPRPLPFSAAALDAPEKTADAAGSGSAADRGTAMALDEGKMGKADSERAEGQYKMQKNQDDPQLAREQAIQQARNAGIIGSKALEQGGAFASLTGTGDVGFDDSNIYGGLLGNEPGEMNGGFGYGHAGFGPGGGTGQGTIGTGRYGKFGHGSGTGVGYGIGGGGGPRTSNVPTISLGQPNANGDLDKAIIRRYIKRNINKIQYCYEKELLAKPSIAGTVNLQFFIAPTGAVASSKAASSFDNNVGNCVAAVVKEIEFPKPKGGGGVQVNYPFTFRPVDWSGTETKQQAAPISHDPPQAPPPPPPPPAPPAPVKVAPPVAPYQPGKDNPLRAQDAALSACLRNAKDPYGAIVVELAYDGTTVKTAVANGTDATTAACIATAAKSAKRPDAVIGTAQRCGFAYGEKPTASLSTIDITADSVKLAGKDIAKIADLVKTEPKIAALATALPKVATGIVVVHEPYVLRPLDAAPIEVVNHVARTLISSGEDLLLATRRGNDWVAFRSVKFPQPPVPVGTGGSWRSNGSKVDMFDPDNERVVLSLYLTKTSLWFGMSRVNEFTELKRDDPEFATKLAAHLHEQKMSAFFVDRDDLEIGGEDATWGDVVKLIDASIAVGFLNWSLEDPAALSARPTL